MVWEVQFRPAGMSKWGSWEALGARLAREQTVFVSLAVAYLITGKGGLALSYGHPAVSLVFRRRDSPSARFSCSGTVSGRSSSAQPR